MVCKINKDSHGLEHAAMEIEPRVKLTGMAEDMHELPPPEVKSLCQPLLASAAPSSAITTYLSGDPLAGHYNIHILHAIPSDCGNEG